MFADELFGFTNDWGDFQLQGGKVIKHEIRKCPMVLKDGRTASFNIQIVPVLDQSQSITNWVLHAQDVGKDEDDGLEWIIDDPRAKLLAEMSHEFEFPLVCIIRTIDLINVSSLQKEQRGLISILFTCSLQLLLLIKNILDFSKIQEKKLLLNPREVFIERVVHEAAQFVSQEIHKKDLDFSLDVSPDVPERILIDKLRLQQVLTNLIRTAVLLTCDKTMICVAVKRELSGAAAAARENHRPEYPGEPVIDLAWVLHAA
jgi:signal transduction histidine kinase